MCREKLHGCKVCKNDYSCPYPDPACPTLNFDEDAFLCPDCLVSYIEGYGKEDEYIEDDLDERD